MMRIRIFFSYWLVLLMLSAVGLHAQIIQAPKNLYGLKNPDKEKEDRCISCVAIINTMPVEVRFGTQIDNRKIYFIFTDTTYFDRIISGKNDGIALDIIHRSQYPCGKDKIEAKSWAHRGTLMKPLFQKELYKNSGVTERGELIIYMGDLPTGFEPDSVECNIIFIKNKYVCHYSNFYDLRGEKWKLLYMPMLMDSLTEAKKKLQTRTISKTWKFVVPFEKNKYEFAAQDVQPIHDSLEHNDYIIKSIRIQAYSSVEGPTDNNILLQTKRAESIVGALQKFQQKNISAEIVANENWVEFLDEIAFHPKHSAMKGMTKDEIKKKLENKSISEELESILRKQRKGILEIELEKKVQIETDDTTEIKKQFESFLKDSLINKALEWQQDIFEKIRTQKLSVEFLQKLEIPKTKNYSLLQNNLVAFKQEQGDSNLVDALKQIEHLRGQMPGNKRILYNSCIIRLLCWQTGKIKIDIDVLKKNLQTLDRSALDKMLVRRLWVNYHILYAEQKMFERNYAEKDKALKSIFSLYPPMKLNDEDIFSLSKFFVAYSKYDWAEAALIPKVKQIDVREDVLFYYLNLTIVKTKSVANKDYRGILLNAINSNKTRFCNLFKAFGRGGISFQLLDNDFLRRTYCENCQ